MAAPAPRPSRPRWVASAYWTAAVLLYAVLGAFFQPLFLLGFWESVPLLLVATAIAVRVLPRGGAPAPRRRR